MEEIGLRRSRNTTLPLAAAIPAPAAIMPVPVPEVTRGPMVRTVVAHQVGVDTTMIEVQVDNDPASITIPMPIIGPGGSRCGRCEEQSAQPQYRHAMQNVRLHCRILSVDYVNGFEPVVFAAFSCVLILLTGRFIGSSCISSQC